MDSAEQHTGDDATRATRRRRLREPLRARMCTRAARRTLVGAGGLLALVATLVAATSAPVAADPVTQVTCTVKLTSVSAPNAPTGEDFGTVACPSVFGDGVVHDTITVTPSSKTAGTVRGRFKEYFDSGTIHGTFKLTYRVGSTGRVSSTGRAKIAGGAGAFEHVKGIVEISCKAADRTHNTCVEKRILTRR
jgi:hypothetical protein